MRRNAPAQLVRRKIMATRGDWQTARRVAYDGRAPPLVVLESRHQGGARLPRSIAAAPLRRGARPIRPQAARALTRRGLGGAQSAAGGNRKTATDQRPIDVGAGHVAFDQARARTHPAPRCGRPRRDRRPAGSRLQPPRRHNQRLSQRPRDIPLREKARRCRQAGRCVRQGRSSRRRQCGCRCPGRAIRAPRAPSRTGWKAGQRPAPAAWRSPP